MLDNESKREALVGVLNAFAAASNDKDREELMNNRRALEVIAAIHETGVSCEGLDLPVNLETLYEEYELTDTFEENNGM